jgi:hypothetical protein
VDGAGPQVQDVPQRAFQRPSHRQRLPRHFPNQEAALVQPFAEGLRADGNSLAPAGHLINDPVAGIWVKVEVVTVNPPNPVALGKPFDTLAYTAP